MNDTQYIDYIGVVIRIGDIINGQSKKAGGREFSKLNIELGDSSSKSIIITLWNESISQYTCIKLNDILVLKYVKVSDYANRSLVVTKQTMIYINNNDIPQVKQLRSFLSYHSNQSYDCITTPIDRPINTTDVNNIPITIKIDDLVHDIQPSVCSYILKYKLYDCFTILTNYIYMMYDQSQLYSVVGTLCWIQSSYDKPMTYDACTQCGKKTTTDRISTTINTNINQIGYCGKCNANTTTDTRYAIQLIICIVVNELT